MRTDIPNVIDRICLEVVKTINKGDLDAPYMHRGNKKYSRRVIIHHIESRSDEGMDFIASVVGLAADLFDRRKRDLMEFKRDQ